LTSNKIIELGGALYMKRAILLILTINLIFSVIGCTKSLSDKEKDKIGIRGQVTKIFMNNDKTVTGIMVEGKVESDTMVDKADIKIDKGTKILIGNTNQKFKSSELKEGMKVEVVFEGPVAESYPVQGKAKTIRIID
jgi:beta-N-acetylhexosaminidase